MSLSFLLFPIHTDQRAKVHQLACAKQRHSLLIILRLILWLPQKSYILDFLSYVRHIHVLLVILAPVNWGKECG